VAALSVPARGRAPVLQDVAAFLQSINVKNPERQAALEAASLGVSR
jgi:hypothetical protein